MREGVCYRVAQPSELGLAWYRDMGTNRTQEATPIVADGVMYLSTPLNDLVALDAVTGIEKWRYRHEMKTEKLCCGPANRGAASRDQPVAQLAIKRAIPKSSSRDQRKASAKGLR